MYILFRAHEYLPCVAVASENAGDVYTTCGQCSCGKVSIRARTYYDGAVVVSLQCTAHVVRLVFFLRRGKHGLPVSLGESYAFDGHELSTMTLQIVFVGYLGDIEYLCLLREGGDAPIPSEEEIRERAERTVRNSHEALDRGRSGETDS